MNTSSRLSSYTQKLNQGGVNVSVPHQDLKNPDLKKLPQRIKSKAELIKIKRANFFENIKP